MFIIVYILIYWFVYWLIKWANNRPSEWATSWLGNPFPQANVSQVTRSLRYLFNQPPVVAATYLAYFFPELPRMKLNSSLRATVAMRLWTLSCSPETTSRTSSTMLLTEYSCMWLPVWLRSLWTIEEAAATISSGQILISRLQGQARTTNPGRNHPTLHRRSRRPTTHPAQLSGGIRWELKIYDRGFLTCGICTH